MISKLLVLLFIAFASTLALKAETEFLKEGTLDLRILGSYRHASNYYDRNGDQVYHLEDKVDTVTRNYSFTFRSYVIGITAEYYMTDNWSAWLSVPVAISTLDETYEKNFYGNNAPKADFLLTQPEYYGIGSKYRFLTSGGFTTSGLFEFRIPPALKNSSFNDSSSQFLDDKVYELLFGPAFSYKMERTRLEADIIYNHRSGDYGDRIMTHAELDFTSVPQTFFRILSNAVLPLTPIDSTVPEFNIRRTPLQEFYVSAGFGFYANINKQFYTNFSYEIRVFGKNTWSLGMLNLTAGFYL